MSKDVLNDSNVPVSVRFTDTHIVVTLADSRLIGAPLDWFPELRDATPEQRGEPEIGYYSIDWPNLDTGMDMEVLLLGKARPDAVSVMTMAEMHGVAPNTIQRILRADQALPEDERRLPGAYKIGTGERRGDWRIPREVAERWRRYTRSAAKAE